MVKAREAKELLSTKAQTQIDDELEGLILNKLEALSLDELGWYISLRARNCGFTLTQPTEARSSSRRNTEAASQG